MSIRPAFPPQSLLSSLHALPEGPGCAAPARPCRVCAAGSPPSPVIPAGIGSSPNLRTLNLSWSRDNLDQVLDAAANQDLSHLEFLNSLLKAEMTAREEKAEQRRMKQADFPFVKTVDEFDFGFQRSITKSSVLRCKHFWSRQGNANAFQIRRPRPDGHFPFPRRCASCRFFPICSWTAPTG